MRRSAGILVFREKDLGLEVFLVHPGGPFWKGREIGAWTVPKGEFTAEEDPLVAARREFREETGQEIMGHFIGLTPVRQKAGKEVLAWAVRGKVDAANIESNTFRVEFPYKSGKWITVPEVDKAAWFPLSKAKEMINAAQVAFLDELVQKLKDEEAV